jgi:multiple sugar transport system substrate-binding protein
MEENPHITVVQEVPGDYNNMLATALAAGTAGDLFEQSNRFAGQFFLEDAIVPVDYTAFGHDEATFLDLYMEPANTLQGGYFEGELYGIPCELSIYSLHINHGLFQEAGLDPETDWPRTWEEFAAVSEKLVKRDAAGRLVQRGGDFPWQSAGVSQNVFGGQLRQLGGAEVTEDYLSPAINSTEGAKVCQLWKDWVDEGLGGPGYQTARAGFNAGAVAMCPSFGSWARPGILEGGIEYSVRPTPRWEDATVDMGCYTYAYFHMVNARSSDAVKRAAWQLAWYLDSHPVRYLESTGLLQPKNEILGSAVYQNSPFLDVFLDEMLKGRYAPSPPGLMEILDVLVRMRERLAEGMEPPETLEIAEGEIQDILDEAWAALG